VADPARAEVLVVGLGNPILGDDGVGWRVIDDLEERLAGRPGAAPAGGVPGVEPAGRLPAACVELERAAVGGVALMERLVGYRRAVLVDAFLGTMDAPGTVCCEPIERVLMRQASHLDSSHDATLAAAIAAGRALDAALPAEIAVVSVAIERGDVFGERLSEPVEAAVPVAAEAVLGVLGMMGAAHGPTRGPAEHLDPDSRPGPVRQQREAVHA
jgi:hydrogenase maturation protease